MGLGSYLEFMQRHISDTFGSDLHGLKMLELGDQQISPNKITKEKFGKHYFTKQGFEHTSVDIHGRNGVVQKDLRDPYQFVEWHNSFDILTNAGTTEHVEPFETQYDCWNILHDCLKVEGLFLHVLPDVVELDERKRWVNHCNTYYSHQFFVFLANSAGYEILESTVLNGNRCVAMVKRVDQPFSVVDRDGFFSNLSRR